MDWMVNFGQRNASKDFVLKPCSVEGLEQINELDRNKFMPQCLGRTDALANVMHRIFTRFTSGDNDSRSRNTLIATHGAPGSGNAHLAFLND